MKKKNVVNVNKYTKIQDTNELIFFYLLRTAIRLNAAYQNEKLKATCKLSCKFGFFVFFLNFFKLRADFNDIHIHTKQICIVVKMSTQC